MPNGGLGASEELTRTKQAQSDSAGAGRSSGDPLGSNCGTDEPRKLYRKARGRPALPRPCWHPQDLAGD